MKTEQRITRMGVPHADLAALLLPRKYLDLTARPASAWEEGNTNAVLSVTVAGPATIHDGPPKRITAPGLDAEGTPVTLVAFGNVRPLQEAWREPEATYVAQGTLKVWREQYQLGNATLAPADWVNCIMPVYPSKKGVLGGERIRDLISERLAALATNAGEWLRSWFREAGEDWDEAALVTLAAEGHSELGSNIDALFFRAHQPRSVAEGEAACRALDRVAARLRIAQMRALLPPASEAARLQVSGGCWRTLLSGTDMKPTESQRAALRAIHEDLCAPHPMRRLLAGDVGSGKTLVYGMAAAGVAMAGSRSAVLLPGEVLVRQVAEEFRSWWPELSVATVTADGVEGDIEAPIMLGTSALLHREWETPFTLFVVDEQQRFSRAQREQLIGDETNLLEVSATPLPRSAALLALGGMEVSHLKPWTEKHIATTVVPRDDAKARRSLFESILADAQTGRQTAIIYPRREEDADSSGRSSAVEMAEAWQQRLPGQVELVHGKTPADEKAAALASMRDGKSQVLVATTVIEVGVDLPALQHIVVVEAERLGLAQLHQLRGRAARRGGEGRMSLITSKTDNEDVMARLNVLVEHQDGARVAWEDTRLRGFGALSGEAQSGAIESPFPGRSVEPEDAEAAADWLFLGNIPFPEQF